MVQELTLLSQEVRFPDSAPAAYPVFFRTYSRKYNNKRESWAEVCDRTLTGLKTLGKLTQAQADLIDKMQKQLKSLTSGRWLWVGGTEWVDRPENFSGSYNCTSTNVIDWRSFGLMMDLAMQGSGTGGVLEPQYISQLPVIRNQLQVNVVGAIGATPVEQRRHNTDVEFDYTNNAVKFFVGDSRQGWVKSYQSLLELCSDEQFDAAKPVQVTVDISDVRPSGEALKGFGGMANPVKLPTLYDRCANILNKAIGRQLTSVECCILIDEAAVCIVAGNIRRCLPAGALVHCEAGLVPIEKIRIGDRVLTSKGFYPVTNFFDQGTQSLCRIKTEDGYFECTADHKVAVLEDVYGAYRMIKAKDLKEGDRLIFVPKAITGTATELPEFKGTLAPQAKRITIPALTADVAYFIGYLHGDGSVGSDGWRVRFRISEDQQQIIDKLIAVGELFGLDTYTMRTPEQSKAKAFELQFNSSALNQYLSQFKRAFTSINIPDCILLATANIREAYLAGLADADGCFSQGVLVASVHSDFLRQVQSVYASLGITVRLCHSTRKRTGKWEGELVTVGEAAFDKISELFAAHSLRFAGSQRVRPQSFKDHGFPKEMVRPIVNTYQYHWSGAQKQMIAPTVQKHIPECTDLIPVKVKSVEFDVRIAPTYDIEVASIHEFVCEGILVSNSAGMRQFSSEDALGSVAKDNLWQQDEAGNWRIDPERDALRMANHTRVFHRKPTEQECVDAVRKQYYSGEGAIQWAGEAIARSNADLITTPELKRDFLTAYVKGEGKEWLRSQQPEVSERELEHRLQRYGLNPCGEIVFSDGHCNLSEVHLNLIDPHNEKELEDAFKAGAISVSVLLNHRFNEERYQFSRDVDPIVGVSFTGLFDFFVHAFGVEWLRWFEAGRPDTVQGLDFKEKEADYLNRWREIVHQTVWEYCDSHGLRRPNRCTTTQPAGCLDHTALRIFDQGLLYADEIVEAGSGESKGLDLSVRNGIATDTAIANQPLNLVRVTLENGRVLRMTPNHRLSIANQWVRADHLELGMDIDYSLGEYRHTEDALLLSLNPAQYTREGRKELLGHGRGVLTAEITTPITLNPELGYFLGCLFGDGAMSEGKDRVRFAFNEKELDLVERLQAIAQNQFGLTGKISHDPRNGGTRGELTFASGQLFDWLKLNQLQKGSSKDLDRIPLAIRESSRETILAFFCGLIDTDGCVRVKGDLSIDSSSEAFIRNLQQVGEAVGLCFGIFHNTQGENFQGQKNMWGLSLSRMLSQPESLAYLNIHSRKCQLRPLPEPKRQFAFHPYRVTSIEFETTPDYSYDFAVSGIDDDDSWYWQGALKSHNTKSLLTGASPGWHPPKAQRFIRRITFRKEDPVARACMDYGYSIIPSQSDKDENGQLLNDPFDPRCTEWLVEIPVSVSWADLDGADMVEISKFDVMAQFDFYMQVQKFYTRHNCFHRDTRFITRHGIFSFNDFEPGDKVEVINANGDWSIATVVCTSSPRTMYRIILQRASDLHEERLVQIVSTEDHRWKTLRRTGGRLVEEVTLTQDLTVEHKIPDILLSYQPSLDVSGIQHGIVLGDGTRRKDTGGCQVYLCGEKRELGRYFPRRMERDDINQTRVTLLPGHYKELPSIDADESYLYGFIAGLLATDGNVCGTCISLSTGQSQVVDWLKQVCPKLGLVISSIYIQKPSGYENSKGAYSVRFIRSSVHDSLILRDFHRQKLKPSCFSKKWKVLSVEKLDSQDYGWCVMEPETNQFALEQNILTYNTSATLELREHEIEPLGKKIYEAIRDDEGYISAALLARFDDLQTFPRLPFEPIDKATYEKLSAEVLVRRKSDDFYASLLRYDSGELVEAGPAGCDSDKCMFPEQKP